MAEDSGPEPFLDAVVCVDQFEPLAQVNLTQAAYDYVAGGAGDELSIARNISDWQDIRLLPRSLNDVSELDSSVSFLGMTYGSPIFMSPTARHQLYTERGELETFAAARAAGSLYIQSSLGSTDFTELAPICRDQPWWFQLYVQRDRGYTHEIVERAITCGAQAIVLTVDTPSLGARDRDKRDSIGVSAEAYFPLIDHSRLEPDPLPAHQRVYNPHLAADVTWDDVNDLVAQHDVPVVTKGVLRAEDARRAVDAGAAAVIVSNHGARNLDTVVSTAWALPAVVNAVGGEVPVLVDGGIRRGTDVAKALALGATAVGVGRPYVWGLSAFGAAGAARAVEILQTELRMAMALLGATSISDLTPDLLVMPE